MRGRRLYTLATELDDALSLMAGRRARVVAGATDVFPAAGDQPLVGDFVDVSRLPALRGIELGAREIRIGAATTWSEIARADLPPAFDALKVAAREIGAVQIQNRGTLGGNLCNASPAADGVPPLLILDAEVALISTRGARRLALGDFLLGNRRTALASDELLAAIIIPTSRASTRSAFLKLGARRYLVISIVMVAVAFDIEEGAVCAARVAIGACSATARRLEAVEARLNGARVDKGLADLISTADFAALTPIDDVRASAAYRLEAALTLTRRAVEACALGEAGGVI